MKVWFREKPKRNSFSRFGEKVWVSIKTPERLTGVLAFPPSAGSVPAVKVTPSYSVHRPVIWSLSPNLWSILISPVLSKVVARTLVTKLLVPTVLGSGQNCSSDLEMGSVTVARWAAVGTIVELGVGATWRK